MPNFLWAIYGCQRIELAKNFEEITTLFKRFYLLIRDFQLFSLKCLFNHLALIAITGL